MHDPDWITFQTARARIVHQLLAHYTRGEIYLRLVYLRAQPSDLVEPLMSDRSLAYQLAWALLPPGPYRADRGPQ